ncbi:BING4CT-domain-containing protein [Pholiota molesta]|nr:BING4CT-domain-containing protein [Pholiota molesta]
MDALIAKADSIQPLNKKRKAFFKSAAASGSSKPPKSDHTLTSVAKHTSLPKSLQDKHTLPDDVPSYKHIANKKLRTHLHRQSAQSARAQTLLEDAEMLLMDNAGGMEVEGEMDRTWRVGQSDIVQSSGQEAAKGRKEYKLDGGPYRSRYTRNGRHLAIAGRTGHVATFDWQTGTMHAELQLQETCRDITFLQDHSFFAVAQKKYVFIYDRDGVELHCLKGHIEPTRLEFLPYHWLLASVGNPGYLKYQDTSTGQLLVEHRTKLGACTTMTQNLHNAVIHLGHQNGCVTLWTPNLPHPAVQLLAHMGPVVSVAVDPSEGGRYMASAGRDGTVKVWDCRNWKGAVREWAVRGGGDPELEWSARGYLAVASGGTVNVYNPPSIHTPFNARTAPPLYVTHPIPHRPLASVRFAPFQDILTIGHAAGLSSILVPGSGEPNFDSREADPFENKKARSEREVKGLLDKIQPDLITLDPEFVGNLAPPSKMTTTTFDGKPEVAVPYARLSRLERLRVSGKIDETEEHSGDDAVDAEGDAKKATKEEREKRKMRGKGKSLKRYLRKQRKNVVDPAAIAIRTKLEKQKEEKKRAAAAAAASKTGEQQKPSALDRFKGRREARESVGLGGRVQGQITIRRENVKTRK